MKTATPTTPNAHTMRADYRLIKVGVLSFFPELTTVTIGVAGVDVDRCADRDGDAESKGQSGNDRRNTGKERRADDQRNADHYDRNEVYSTTHQATFRSREGQTGSWHDRIRSDALQPHETQWLNETTGISEYGSLTVKPLWRLPLIMIAIDGSEATMASEAEGRVNCIYASTDVRDDWREPAAALSCEVSPPHERECLERTSDDRRSPPATNSSAPADHDGARDVSGDGETRSPANSGVFSACGGSTYSGDRSPITKTVGAGA